MAGLFITGTDTGIGKTWATMALMRFFQERGITAIGMKPVATGCQRQDGALRNEDALQLQRASSVLVDYEKLNIYAYEPPISPNIAARLSGGTIEIDAIVRQYRELKYLADVILVEGVGGWEVPINDDGGRVSHLALALGLPVLLVVGMRIGCLNHALLTHDAMLRIGADCLGWIANCVDGAFPFLAENLKTLEADLSFPLLGVIRHGGMLDGGEHGEKLAEPLRFRGFFELARQEILRT